MNPNGSLDAGVLFVGEAPGRLGADKYGIPLYGDQTGRNFQAFLDGAGLRREEVFITNAVLCNPRDGLGNNDTPSAPEVRLCSGYLRETIDIIRPRLLAPLGATALASLKIIQPHAIALSAGVGRAFDWRGCHLYPLYHPGPRSLLHRSKARQAADYSTLGLLVRATAVGHAQGSEARLTVPDWRLTTAMPQGMPTGICAPSVTAGEHRGSTSC